MSMPAPLDRRASRLTRLYVLALSAVAALSITGQILVQQALHRQQRDSTVINIAGRQRMLSQKLTKAALVWSHARTDAERAAGQAEMNSTLELWTRSHAGLQQGDQELHLPRNRSPAIAKMFAELQPTFDEMVNAARELATEKARQDDPGALAAESRAALARLLNLEPGFLASMDAVVFQLDDEARAHVARLQRIEWALLSLTLLVLVSEGCLVFRPAVKRIHAAARALLESEQELRVAKEAAESASEQKTQFLATLSHELRNPLHAILGNSELLLKTRLDTEQRGQLTAIDRAARSLLCLVNDLLDLACLQAGKLRMQSGIINLRELGDRVQSMVAPQAQRKALRLSKEFAAGPLFARGDELRLQQVLLNLLGNAVKFTEFGLIRLRIFSPSNNTIRLEVHDTGPGIPADNQQEIFAAFKQIDSGAKRESAGVGLGLAISARLLELMNGRLGVSSEAGKGSCFWLELPVAAPGLSATLSSSAPKIHPARSAGRILIADDDAVNRKLLADFLLHLGHEPIIASGGQSALAIFKTDHCDAVLLDWHMPQLDGLELAREIRLWEVSQQREPVPLIAVSAAGEIADKQAACDAGIQRMLTKPLSLGQLQSALEQVLPKKARHTANVMSCCTHEQPANHRFAASLARMQGKIELFHAVAGIFLAEAPRALSQRQQELDAGDFAALGRGAHLLAGQGANFDAVGLVAAAKSLETAAAERDYAACTAALTQITACTTDLLTELEIVG